MTNFSDLFPTSSVINTQTFTSTGTWTKPAGALPSDIVIIDLWGAGGSGGVRASGSDTMTGGPGGGGAHNRVECRVADLNSTETATVGTGGAAASSTGSNANGSSGGYSEFKGHRAYGGGGGGGIDYGSAGTGGGIYSKGFDAVSVGRGGEPQTLSPISLSVSTVIVTSGSAPYRWGPGEWGGGGTNPTYVEPDYQSMPIHGGAGGMAVPASSYRSSVWGGAAGGCYDGGTLYPPGTSQFGGNGGTAPTPATNTTNANGTAGSPRGGGGGGGKRGTTGTATSGAGGRGEIVVTIIRGG